MEKQIEDKSGLNSVGKNIPTDMEQYKGMSFDELASRLQATKTAREEGLKAIAGDRERVLNQYPTVRELLETLQSAADDLTTRADEERQKIEQSIKARVLEAGATQRYGLIQAVFTGPKVTWNGKLLQGYAVAHPEILDFRKSGAPSVSIRWGDAS